ncbi:MAG: alpha-mannosidase [Eubacterium sp.]|nr:alpha-mannosidase [Eubacterium sp.]
MSKKVFTIANAHLDTIWSWDFETTVSEYIYNTIKDNLRLFDKYPDYKFNFEGAYRYELMEEYYPELFKSVKRKIKEGSWNVTGSAYENGDVNVPSPEALFRNFLYGNNYFSKKFNTTSSDIFLPDCFGFGWALPSIAHHAQLKGFSTQKLSWGSAYKVPFDLGKWYGVDGNYIYAALKMHSYDQTLKKVRNWGVVTDKLEENEKIGLDMTAVYYGTGDRGGAPDEESVRVLEKEMAQNGVSDVQVFSSAPDDIYNALDALDSEVKDKLPTWNNELLMSTHAVGSYVSRSISKRWNRRGEELADMAEKSAAFAYAIGREYPQKTLESCWKRIIRHQFHDDITGTSVQRAYRRVWNDYALSINQLIGEYEASSKFIADRLDTSWCEGRAIIVNNPCEYDRRDVVEVLGSFDIDSYVARGENGDCYPCQKTENGLVFIADMPPLAYKVFDVCEGKAEFDSSLAVTENCLENAKLKVTIKDGLISSIIDKSKDVELLSAPVRLALYDYEGSTSWPAWEIPSNAATGKAHYPKFVRSEIIENGCVRCAVKLEYKYNKSRFCTIVSLAENGEMVEFQNEIMWHEKAAIAKQIFSLNASDEYATFDLGLGAIKRPNRTEKLYEVPAQKWADISGGDVNVSIISDSKYSWDKYNDNTLRLTVLHTPKRNYRIDSMQSMMDLGLNRYGFAITAHDKNDFVKTNRLAKNFHQRLTAFEASKHEGEYGTLISFGKLCGDNVLLRAVKKAENSNDIILRFNEINDENAQDASFEFFCKIKSAKEVFASEKAISDAQYNANKLTFDMNGYGIKSFSVSLEKSSNEVITQTPVELNGNADAYSSNDSAKKSLLSFVKLSIPTELTPKRVFTSGIEFELNADKKALMTRGQRIKLPTGTKKVHLLCGSLDTDKTVYINGRECRVNSISERYAGWDLYDYGETAFIKDGRVGFEFTHCHSDKGDEIAKSLLFWIVTVDVENDMLILPNDDILILAITAEADERSCALKSELFEKVEQRKFDYTMSRDELKEYKKYKRYSRMNDKGRYFSTRNK